MLATLFMIRSLSKLKNKSRSTFIRIKYHIRLFNSHILLNCHTQVDPLRHGLLFERFLNLNRNNIPDIDIDFCQRNRENVI
ncbi:MAG: hypothetical protein ACTS68_01820, partial [Candidatus Hodgkinia cicadicola]